VDINPSLAPVKPAEAAFDQTENARPVDPRAFLSYSEIGDFFHG
jgi:hypothetical protein